MEPRRLVEHLVVAAIVVSLPAAAVMWAFGVGIGVAAWVVGTAALGAYSLSSSSRGRP
jgi:hypothetical protein